MVFWRTKAAISLKSVKMEKKLLWRAYRNSPTLFRTFHPRPPMASPLGFLQLPGTGKAIRTSNFVATFIGLIGTKVHEKCWVSSCGRCQGVPKIFRAPMYRAHCTVIFAIAQLYCAKGMRKSRLFLN